MNLDDLHTYTLDELIRYAEAEHLVEGAVRAEGGISIPVGTGRQVLSEAEALKFVTLNPAKHLRIADRVGSLEPGKQADVIQVAFDDVHHVPLYDVVSHLVYVTDEQDVASVVVDGRVLMRDVTFLTLEPERITREARALAARIQAALASRNSN